MLPRAVTVAQRPRTAMSSHEARTWAHPSRPEPKGAEVRVLVRCAWNDQLACPQELGCLSGLRDAAETCCCFFNQTPTVCQRLSQGQSQRTIHGRERFPEVSLAHWGAGGGACLLEARGGRVRGAGASRANSEAGTTRGGEVRWIARTVTALERLGPGKSLHARALPLCRTGSGALLSSPRLPEED